MVDTVHDSLAAVQALGAHRRTFHAFSKLVLFAILHIALVLACLALAFLGNSPLIALLLGAAGTAALIMVFVAYS